jgi:hypothetical protein
MRFIAKLLDTVSGWLRPAPLHVVPEMLDLTRTPLERRLLGDSEA